LNRHDERNFVGKMERKKNEIRKRRENRKKENGEKRSDPRRHTYIYAFLRGTVTCEEKLNDVT